MGSITKVSVISIQSKLIILLFYADLILFRISSWISGKNELDKSDIAHQIAVLAVYMSII